MMLCTSCGRKIKDGGYCQNCGELFCDNHVNCPRCDIKLDKIKIKYETSYNHNIIWINSKKMKVGLSGYDSSPKELMTIFNKFDFSKDIDVILFKSKDLSDDFLYNFEEHYGIKLLIDFLPESTRKISRYTILLAPTGAFTDTFLLEYLMMLRKNKKEYPMKSLPLLDETIIKIFQNYIKKVGLPLIEASEEKMNALISIYANTISIYSEYMAIKQLNVDKNIHYISDFLNYKIQIHFDSLDSKYLDRFLEIISIIGYYITIFIIKQYSKMFYEIHDEVSRLIDKNHKTFLNKLGDYPDLSNALNYIVKQEIGEFNTIEELSSLISDLYLNATNFLEPRYNELPEVISMFHIASIYSENIKQYVTHYIPEIGFPEDFNRMMLNIFNNDIVNLKIRIICGQLALEVLMEQILVTKSFDLYKLFLTISTELSDLIYKSMPTLEKNAENTDTINLFKNIDAVRILLVASKMAQIFEEKDVYKKLIDSSLAISVKRNLLSQQISILWLKYIETHNFNNITKIYHLFPASIQNIDDSELSYIKTVGNVSKSMLENDWSDYIEEAKKYAEDIYVPDMGDLVRSSRSSFIYVMFVKILEYVLNAKNNFNTIHESNKYNNALLMESAPNEPLISFVYKTRILDGIINQNYEVALSNIKMLSDNFDSDYISEFCEKTNMWIDTIKTKKGISFTKINEIIIDRNIDPWEKLFIMYANNIMNGDLNEHLVNYDYIIFVEGECDVEILKAFSNKLYDNQKLLFLDATGYTNLAMMIKDSKITALNKIPIYYLFDGDTINDESKRKIRYKLIDQLEISSKHIFTLSHNSIENYILNSKAIKMAYPEISYDRKQINDYLNANKMKKNKKRVIDKILKNGNIGKYDKIKASKIAEKIPKNEIDKEIKRILSEITNF